MEPSASDDRAERWCQRKDCAATSADRDRWRTMATDLHRGMGSELGLYEARAYLVRDEQYRDQIGVVQERLRLAEAALQAHMVGRNPYSEVTAWQTYVKETEA